MASGLRNIEEAWLKEQDELHIEQHFTDVKKKFAELYQPLIDLVTEVEGGLAQLSETNQQKIIGQIDFLRAANERCACKAA